MVKSAGSPASTEQPHPWRGEKTERRAMLRQTTKTLRMIAAADRPAGELYARIPSAVSPSSWTVKSGFGVSRHRSEGGLTG